MWDSSPLEFEQYERLGSDPAPDSVQMLLEAKVIINFYFEEVGRVDLWYVLTANGQAGGLFILHLGILVTDVHSI